MSLKAYFVDETLAVYAAESLEHAAELYEGDVQEKCTAGYPYEASDADLDEEFPEFDADEQMAGRMTTMRAILATARPGLMCEYP